MYCIHCFVWLTIISMYCADTHKGIINVPDQHKTGALLFIKVAACNFYQWNTVKLFAWGTTTCLFSENKDASAQTCHLLKNKEISDQQWRKTTFCKRWFTAKLQVWEQSWTSFIGNIQLPSFFFEGGGIKFLWEKGDTKNVCEDKVLADMHIWT